MGEVIQFKEIKRKKITEQLLKEDGYVNKYKLAIMLLTKDEIEELEKLLEEE